MHSKIETCCSKPLSSQNGYFVCLECGLVHRPHCDTRHTSFTQRFGYVKPAYSRKYRLEKKLIASLQCLAHYKIDVDLVAHLKKISITTPEQLLVGIASYPKKKPRKPYIYAPYYWVSLGKTLPKMTKNDIRLLTQTFDHIFFAWHRLRVRGPHFPYSYLMRKIVADSKAYSEEIKYLMRFLRVLRCRTRRIRYDKLFQICKNLDLKNVTYHIINEHDDNESDDRNNSE